MMSRCRPVSYYKNRAPLSDIPTFSAQTRLIFVNFLGAMSLFLAAALIFAFVDLPFADIRSNVLL